MNDIFPEFTTPQSENNETMDHISQHRRRFRSQDIKDEDEVIPQLCSISKERPVRARQASIRSVLSDEDADEYEIISSKEFTQSLPLSTRAAPTRANTGDVTSRMRTAWLTVLDQLADEATRRMQLVQSVQSMLLESNSCDSLSGLATQQSPSRDINDEPASAKSSSSTAEQSRSRAFSLSNAVADLRDLPWHIDFTSYRESGRDCPTTPHPTDSSHLTTIQKAGNSRASQREIQDFPIRTSTDTARTDPVKAAIKRLRRTDRLPGPYALGTGEAVLSTSCKNTPPTPVSRTDNDLVFSYERSNLGDSWTNIDCLPASV